jgi:hypothetical protein
MNASAPLVQTLPEGMPTPERVRVLKISLTQLLKSPGNLRTSNEVRARQLAAKWDDFYAGTVHVSHRDGHMYVIDGWHRVLAARIRGEKSIWATIIEGYGEAEEALAFDILNTKRVRIGSGAEFWARIMHGEPIATEVLAICQALDITIVDTDHPVRTPGETRAYSSLQWVHREFGPEVLRETLLLLREAYPQDPKALYAELLGGLAAFVALYRIHPHWSHKHFVLALANLSPNVLLQRAHSLSGAISGTSRGTDYFRQVLLAVYNWRMSSRRLPDTTAGERHRIYNLHQNPWLTIPTLTKREAAQQAGPTRGREDDLRP